MGFTRGEKTELIDLIKETFSTLSKDIADTISANVKESIEDNIKTFFGNYESRILNLEENNIKMSSTLDQYEQYTRKNSIRINGISEQRSENILEVVSNLLLEKLNISISPYCIDNCHRVINKKYSDSAHKKSRYPPPVIVKFTSHMVKEKVFNNKKLFKGSGISVAEDLTAARYKLYRAAAQKFGVKHVWTRNGNVFAEDHGKRLSIKVAEDIIVSG